MFLTILSLTLCSVSEVQWGMECAQELEPWLVHSPVTSPPPQGVCSPAPWHLRPCQPPRPCPDPAMSVAFHPSRGPGAGLGRVGARHTNSMVFWEGAEWWPAPLGYCTALCSVGDSVGPCALPVQVPSVSWHRCYSTLEGPPFAVG